MKIIENKYVLLRTKRPHLVTEKVEDYRIIKKDDDGFYELSVNGNNPRQKLWLV